MNNFRQKKRVNNLDEMAKVLERHKLPKLIQEEIDNLNGHLSVELLV